MKRVAAAVADEQVVVGAAVEGVVAAAAGEEVGPAVAMERGEAGAQVRQPVGAVAAVQLGVGLDAALDGDDVAALARVDRHDLADPGEFLRLRRKPRP